jgi:HD-GYP domain-containing protein (c-di-GMP phosphodiesterase class II)
MPTAVDQHDRARSETQGYLPIGIDTLVPTSTLEFDLYIRPDRTGAVVMFRERSYPLESEDLDRLRETGVATLYITVAAHVAYRRYLHDEVIHNDRVPPTQRYAVLRIAHRAVFETALRSGNVDRMVGFAGEFGEQMTDLVCDQGLVLTDLLPLMAHDYYTYTHVTNVCTYCLVLAGGLGIRNQGDLLAIASGALLHDLGKRHVPPSVLNHPGRLTDELWEMVRRHPGDGFRELCLREDLTWTQLMMVYQHHERLDGRGYPVGITGDGIHKWARICKIADVFDALSSDRPYRKAEPPDRVLDFLHQRVGTEFDKEMVLCLLAMLKSAS